MSETVNDYDDLLEEAEHHWRNRVIGVVVLAVLIAAGAYALWAMVLSDGGSSAEGIQTATVQRGSITNTLSTSGVVVAQSTADLSFGQSGVVTAVNVTLGQEVEEGEVLAEMEAHELESALTTAELNLASAQAKLDELLEGASESELASADQSLLQAQQSLEQAESALEDLSDAPSESELASAELAVASAESELAMAEESRTKLYSDSDDAVAAAEQAVERAEKALDDAEESAADAGGSVSLAKAKLKAEETAYCDYELDCEHVSFCTKRATPISTGAEVILYEVTITGTQECAAQAQQVLSANTSYENAVKAKDSASDAVDSAEADLEAAKDDLEEAKEGPSSADIAAADVKVASAQLSLDEAKEKLAELIAGPTEDDLETAQSNIDQAAAGLAVAQAKWNDAYGGPDSLDIELERDKVRQAELSVEQARDDLEKAQIIAPFDGTVAELNIELGQEVSTGGQEAAIVLNTPDALRLRLTVTESDRPEVEVGQSGFATFDAIGETPFPFVIDAVGTSPTTTQGVVTYEAWAKVLSAPAAAGPTGTAPRGQAILATAAELLGMTEEELQTALQSGQTMAELAEAQGISAEELQAALMEQAGGAATPEASAPEATATPSASDSAATDATGTSSKPLPGMNASVTITVDQAQDVLLVPAQAVQTEGFQSVVEVLNDDGSTEKVVVQTGLSDAMNTEITEGLEEGQTIIVPTRVATAVETTTGGEFPQGGFFRQGEVPEGGPSFFIGPGGSAP